MNGVISRTDGTVIMVPKFILLLALASGGTVWYHLVYYGGEEFVSKNVSKIWYQLVKGIVTSHI